MVDTVLAIISAIYFVLVAMEVEMLFYHLCMHVGIIDENGINFHLLV